MNITLRLSIWDVGSVADSVERLFPKLKVCAETEETKRVFDEICASADAVSGDDFEVSWTITEVQARVIFRVMMYMSSLWDKEVEKLKARGERLELEEDSLDFAALAKQIALKLMGIAEISGDPEFLFHLGSLKVTHPEFFKKLQLPPLDMRYYDQSGSGKAGFNFSLN